jgi:hypothetical protein
LPFVISRFRGAKHNPAMALASFPLIQVGCLYKIAHTRLTTRPARFSRLGAIEPIGFARGPGGRSGHNELVEVRLA